MCKIEHKDLCTNTQIKKFNMKTKTEIEKRSEHTPSQRVQKLIQFVTQLIP